MSLKHISLAAASLLVSTLAYAQGTATATGTVLLNVTEVWSLAETTQTMNFGTIAGTATPGAANITLLPAGTETSDNTSAYTTPANNTNVAADNFLYTGPTLAGANAASAGSMTWTSAPPNSSTTGLIVSNFNIDTSAVAQIGNTASYSGLIKVGATLAIPAGQLAGAYKGTYTLTVPYN